MNPASLFENTTLPTEQLKALSVLSLGLQQLFDFCWNFLFVMLFIRRHFSLITIQHFMKLDKDPMFKMFQDALKLVVTKLVITVYALFLYRTGFRIITTGWDMFDAPAVVGAFIVSTEYSHKLYKVLDSFVPSKMIKSVIKLVAEVKDDLKDEDNEDEQTADENGNDKTEKKQENEVTKRKGKSSLEKKKAK
jgi:hypothetical protein